MWKVEKQNVYVEQITSPTSKNPEEDYELLTTTIEDAALYSEMIEIHRNYKLNNITHSKPWFNKK